MVVVRNKLAFIMANNNRQDDLGETCAGSLATTELNNVGVLQGLWSEEHFGFRMKKRIS